MQSYSRKLLKTSPKLLRINIESFWTVLTLLVYKWGCCLEIYSHTLLSHLFYFTLIRISDFFLLINRIYKTPPYKHNFIHIDIPRVRPKAAIRYRTYYPWLSTVSVPGRRTCPYPLGHRYPCLNTKMTKRFSQLHVK